ncbi:heme NO-binding domain-containing protein [Gemmatimonas sp.]|uniref:heme NO-binding domain-containing protein n=1 Tax=Gemmatimonas sp. TaxID=1962908 RepID=UPI00286E98CA|nr:heme NO-binding domain-containing protein [Gemmatimonas sp.]
MRSILVLLEDIVRLEFGPGELASVRAVASAHVSDAVSGTGSAVRVTAFVRALCQVRRRPLPEVYAFVGLKLAQSVVTDFPMVTRDRQSTRLVLLQINQLAPAVLDALVPGVEVPAFDVELIDAESVRVSFTGTPEMASLLEGAVRGLGQHFGERVEPTRASPPSYAPNRRLIDIKITPDRRTEDAPSPTGVDRRKFFSF